MRNAYTMSPSTQIRVKFKPTGWICSQLLSTSDISDSASVAVLLFGFPPPVVVSHRYTAAATTRPLCHACDVQGRKRHCFIVMHCMFVFLSTVVTMMMTENGEFTQPVRDCLYGILGELNTRLPSFFSFSSLFSIYTPAWPLKDSRHCFPETFRIVFQRIEIHGFCIISLQ